jgi:hypothetical protein
VVDVILIGKDIDNIYITWPVEKAEELIKKKIKTLVYDSDEGYQPKSSSILIYV